MTTSRAPIAYADSLAFLLSQVGARSAEIFSERLAEVGIAPRQFAVLSHICNGEPRTQQQLSDLLGVHRNSMVALIDGMEAAGWVSRERGEIDRRVFEIHPTSAGSRVVRRINRVIPTLDAALTRTLDGEQVEQLMGALRTIASDLGLAHAIHPHVASRAYETGEGRGQ